MRVACALANLGSKGVVKTLLLSHATTGGVQKGSGDALCYSCRCSVGGETIRLSSQSSRVRYSAPLLFFPVFLFLFFFSFFFFLPGRWCPLYQYVCSFLSFFFCNTPPTCNHHHCIDTPPLHRKGGGRRAVGYRKVA